MPISNSQTHYGSVAKIFHWTVAFAILTIIPIGLLANRVPYDTSESLAFKATLFSIHKTLGVTIFIVALARIAWAIIQPKPSLLNADKKVESFLAHLVHWLLYASLVIVPLTGWMAHASTTGFAPIWGPFGQSLPFVSKDESLSHIFSSLHIIFERVLIFSIALHIVGALKHHFVDGDATLRRMLPGQAILPDFVRDPGSKIPVIAAVGVFAIALGVGAGMGMLSAPPASNNVTKLQEVESEWKVEAGSIDISVFELGSTTKGNFSDWTAEIDFKEIAEDGVHGSVSVQIALSSLKLGSVTDVAIGPEFFDVVQFPTAAYAGQILFDGTNYLVDGTLEIRDTKLPLQLPFSLAINDGIATMKGSITVDRRDFGVGNAYQDEGQVGFDVDVEIALTASRKQSE